MNRRGYVYLITVGPFVKIGFSRDLTRRLKKLRACCPYPMAVAAAVPGTRWLERDYQLRFASHQLYGQAEWFHLRGDLAEYLAHLRAGGVPMWEPGGFDYREHPHDLRPETASDEEDRDDGADLREFDLATGLIDPEDAG